MTNPRPEERQVEVVDNVAASRFELRVDGALVGFTDYRDEGDRLVFTHAEIDDAFEGEGLGGRLAAGALDDVRRRGLWAVPRCPFIRAYIQHHPAYADLVP